MLPLSCNYLTNDLRDSVVALVRFHETGIGKTHFGVAALVTIVILILLPASRVVAQQLWQFLTVRKVGVIRVKPWPEGVQ